MENIDLKDLFKTDEDFEKELSLLKKEITGYEKYENHLLDSPEKLYEYFEYDNNISKRFERLANYAMIKNDLDTSVDKYQGYEIMIHNLSDEINEKSNFVSPEIISHDYEEISKMIKEYPKLKEYEVVLKNLFRVKKCIKSKEEELLISYLTSNNHKPSEVSSFLLDTDLDYGTIKDEEGKDVKLTNSNYSVYLESTNQKVRKAAFESMYKTIESHKNTFASILSSEASMGNKYAKVRGFDSARDYSLYVNEIDPKVYDNLIKGVANNLDKFYKYYDAKKEILNLKEMHLYDTYANVCKSKRKYTFEEAKDLVINALQPLGKEYITNLKRAFDEAWIDFEVRDNKRGGGYCTCVYLSHPYVVINFEGTYDDVSTLAHELGHAMHFLYGMENNPYQYYQNPIFTAEVASQVNELLLADYVLKHSTDKDEKRYILDQSLSRFKATIIRQTMFAEFEKLLYDKEKAGTSLTNEEITKSYYDLNKKYFGSNIIVDEKIKYECYRIPHFYYDFYVYQYATGYASAMKIANGIINHDNNALEKYLEFLKIGSTIDPVSSLKVSGVDINDENIYNEVFDTFSKELKLYKTK